MKDSTRKKIVYVVAGLALVWSLANMGDDKSDKAEIPAPAQRALASKVLPTADKLVINVNEKKALAWGIDPFRHKKIRKAKPAVKIVSKPVWKLSGILYNSTSPVAYINKNAVRVGDIINKARVVTIERKSVTLELKGNRFTIQVTRG